MCEMIFLGKVLAFSLLALQKNRYSRHCGTKAGVVFSLVYITSSLVVCDLVGFFSFVLCYTENPRVVFVPNTWWFCHYQFSMFVNYLLDYVN